jgi:hypothetical protein
LADARQKVIGGFAIAARGKFRQQIPARLQLIFGGRFHLPAEFLRPNGQLIEFTETRIHGFAYRAPLRARKLAVHFRVLADREQLAGRGRFGNLLLIFD